MTLNEAAAILGACRCGHAFETHDPIDAQFAGPCAECDCEEYGKPTTLTGTCPRCGKDLTGFESHEHRMPGARA